MSQIRCLGFLNLLFLAPMLLTASEISLNCSIEEAQSKIPLNLVLKHGEALNTDDSADSDSPRAQKIESTAKEGENPPIQLKGLKEKMEGYLDWERLQYEPLGLLGMMESDVANATFYYAKEDENSRDYDLILVAVERKDKSGESLYAGSYGNYKGRNVLCPLAKE